MACYNIFCPDCEPIFNKRKIQIGQVLVEIERNYSGCGVDIYDCPVCKHCFQISYKIDKIERLKDWETNG